MFLTLCIPILYTHTPSSVQFFLCSACANHFCSQNGRFSRHFGIFHRPKRVTMGSKKGSKYLFGHPKWSTITFGTTRFQLIFDPGPFSRHFGIFHGPKRVTTGSKQPKNTCLSIPNGLGTTFEKMIFSPQGPWWTHCWPPPCSGQAALRLNQVTTGMDEGIAVSLGKSEAGKPQKVGGRGWTRCPRNSVLSHVAQDTARSWFWGAVTNVAPFGPFLDRFSDILRS